MPAPKNLVTIRPGVTLAAPAAASFKRAEASWGSRIDVNSSYRDYDEQQELRDTWLAFSRNKVAWRKANPGKPDPPFALDPDESMHCKGLAVDSDDHRKPGFEAHMSDHGWRQTALGIREPWHHDYFPALDKHQGEPAGGGEVPLPVPDEKETTTMRKVRSDYTGKRYVIGEFSITVIADAPPGDSEDYLHAKAYTDADHGEPFELLKSKACAYLLDDAKVRRAQFLRDIGQAAAAARVEAEVNALVAAENAG